MTARHSNMRIPPYLQVMGGFVVISLAMGIFAGLAEAQWGRGWGGGRRNVPSYGDRIVFPGSKFTFCTVAYRSVRSEPLGFGWNTDYPDSGYNFMTRLGEDVSDASRQLLASI